MPRRISEINGIKYYYFYDNLYINKGVTKTVTFSMGRADLATKEKLQEKEQKLVNAVIKREASERSSFWKNKVKNVSVYSEKNISEVETLRTKLFRLKEVLGVSGQSAMESAFIIDFVYNSNKIEGSRVPRSEVQKTVEGSNTGQNDEVNDTLKAKDFVDSSLFKWNFKSLLKLQSILLEHDKPKIGFRTGPIIVGDDKSLVDAQEIKPALKDLFNWIKKEKFSLYPPEFAAEFYFKFEKIHPFKDGNCRCGRLLFNKLLKECRYHPIIIWNKNRKSHFNSFLKKTSGYDVPFHQFFYEQMKKTYLTYTDKLEKANQFEELVKQFLSPTE